MTDSGGFQVFSLAKKKDITDDGVRFKNQYNGDELFLTPEKSIQIISTNALAHFSRKSSYSPPWTMPNRDCSSLV